MVQSFSFCLEYPDTIIKSLGFDTQLNVEIKLVVNITLTEHKTPFVVMWDSNTISHHVYDQNYELSDIETVHALVKACEWFMPYFSTHKWRSTYLIVMSKCDEILKQYIIANEASLDLREKISVLKTILNQGLVMPLCEELLDALLEELAVRKLMNKKATIIQRIWRDIVVNPNHPVCQSRLRHEFEEMVY